MENHRKAADTKQAEMALDWQTKFTAHEQRVKELAADTEKQERGAGSMQSRFARQEHELEQEHGRKKQALEIETADLTRQVADLRQQLSSLVGKVSTLAE